MFGKLKRQSQSQECPELLRQFFVTLRAEYEKCKKTPQAGNLPEICKRIDDIFKETGAATCWQEAANSGCEPSWRCAYEIEQLLVVLFDEPRLKAELARRLVEASNNLLPEKYESYKAECDATTDAEVRRALLNRLIDDLQWRYSIRDEKRNLSMAARTRTGLLVVSAMVGFFAALIVRRYWADSDLLVACVAGIWGASFSMLISLNRRLEESTLDDLKIFRRWGYIVSRCIIGAGAATILFFFLQANLVSGMVLPEFNHGRPAYEAARAAVIDSFEHVDMATELYEKMEVPKDAWEAAIENYLAIFDQPESRLMSAITQETKRLERELLTDEHVDKRVKASWAVFTEELSRRWKLLALRSHRYLDAVSLALLIVWSFLAGFSEQFVPNLLRKTEKEVQVRKPSEPQPQ